MKLALALLFAAAALPAFAQEGRFVDPQPVNFDAPFLYDGVRTRPLPYQGGATRDGGPTKGIPIEQWLANGRKMEGLREAAPPQRTLDVLDGERLRELFQDLLPVETPAEKAPSPGR